jgi:hypothetical protein
LLSLSKHWLKQLGALECVVQWHTQGKFWWNLKQKISDCRILGSVTIGWPSQCDAIQAPEKL